MDKISLAHIIIQKIFMTINQYNNIYRKLRNGEILMADINNDEDWQLCWQNLLEIYDYIEYQYIGLLSLKFDGKKKESQNVMDKLDRIINKYREHTSKLSFEDLQFAYTNIRFITTKVGLHNVDTYGGDKTRSLLEPEGDWFSW
jgi:hypothetical protein